VTKTTAFTLSVTLALTVATPTITPNGGSFSGSVSVAMQSATSGASIYYTTNGSTPTQSSTLYTGAMTLTSDTIVKAKAFKSGSNASGEASASFTVSQLQVAGTGKGVTRYADGQLSSNCTSGNYSIAKRNCTGSDGNAYKSLQDASNASAAGDTILVRSFAGIYTGSSDQGGVVPKSGTTINNRSVIQGYQGELPRISGIGDTNRDSSFIVVKDVIFDGINNCNACFGVVSMQFVRLENVEVRDFGGHGMAGLNNSEFINMNVHHNGFRANPLVDCGNYCHGIYSAVNLLFDGGEYHHNFGYGIHCYAACQNTTIRNVRVHDNGATGMIVASNAGNVVHNVVADNNRGVGIWLAASGVVADHLTAYNNSGGDILVSSFANITIKDSIALNGISDRDGLGFIGSNNITSGSADSLFIDAANGNFQLKSTSTVQGVGADLASLSY
jgi:hypothetical protein